jgi:ABC-type multidrug transport system fused ATPase/permease subunit
LQNINLTIPRKSKVCIVGPTGSGKTTTIDIILGLLEPQKGTLKVDGKVIKNKSVISWQRIIGYVPQQIYLTDDTIAANIAFGVDSNNIDKLSIEKASKIANLHEFITNELPEKYQTIVGERGVRLSGGQRQRIGIARALYFKPKLIIFDEATNALDKQTEQAIMDSISSISKDITIIKVTHRLNTVKNSDIIFKFEKGRLIEQSNL